MRHPAPRRMALAALAAMGTLLACDDDPTGPGTNVEDLEVTVYAVPATIEAGLYTAVVLTAYNPTRRPISFRSSCPALGWAVFDDDGRQLFITPDTQDQCFILTTSFIDLVIGPGEAWTTVQEWHPELPPGTYILRGAARVVDGQLVSAGAASSLNVVEPGTSSYPIGDG